MRIINWRKSEDLLPGNFSFVNLYSYILLRNRCDLAAVNYMSDGFLICMLAKVFGKELYRYSFDMTSLAPLVFGEFGSKKFAVIGSSDTSINIFVNFIQDEFSILPVYSRSGFFEKIYMDEICLSIIASGAEVVIVGLGTPLQEEFLVRLTQLGYSGTAFTCGGFITQTATASGVYYPELINKLNLRFLYRMFKEPHTIKRYFFSYPKGAALFVYDCFKNKNTFI